MANPGERAASVSVSETSPLSDEIDLIEEYGDGGCGCFRALCFDWRGRGQGRYLLQQQEDEEVIREIWLRERAKKIKEFSEVVAGPKWKNIIRRLSLNNKKRSASKMQFHYDPQSYKLNFDDGINGEFDDGHVGFSARYAGPVVINNNNNKGELGM
ncbi:hypothetical protein AB3S75_016312 [Citrus x aurantiifolia]